MCFSTTLSLYNGVWVCDACGTQTQGGPIEQAEQDFDPNRQAFGAIHRRSMATSARPQAQKQSVTIADRPAEEKQIREMARVYVRCLQRLLQAQSEALSSIFEQPDLIPLIRQLWLDYIPLTGIIQSNHQQMMTTWQDIQDVRTKIRASAAGQDRYDDRDAGDAVYDGEVGGNADAVQQGSEEGPERPSSRKKSSSEYELLAGQATHPSRISPVFKRHLRPSSTLSICFVAALILRLPVTPMDLQKLVIQGKLPFHDLTQRCQETLRSVDPLHIPPFDLMNPSTLPEPNELILSAIYITKALKRPLPNVNGEELISKCCKDLHLPTGISLIARELYRLYLIDLKLMNLSSISENSSPYISIASIVSISLQLGYGIGQVQEGIGLGSRLPCLPDPPPSWIEWAERQMSSDACQPFPGMPLHASDIYQGALSPSDGRHFNLDQYIAFCHRHKLASGSKCHTQLQGVQKVLQEMSRHTLEEGQSPHSLALVRKKRPRGGEEEMRNEQLRREAWEDLVIRSREVLPLVLRSKEYGRSCRIESFVAVTQPRSSSMAADLVALIAVAASWSNSTPVVIISTISNIQKHMVLVDDAAQDLQRKAREGEGGAGRVKVCSTSVS